GEQSGIQVLMKIEDGAVENAKSPRLVGEYTAQRALEQLLGDSGLKYEFVNERTVRISTGDKRADAGEKVSVAQGEGATSPAGAGAQGPKLEEIVVTAQKKRERLQDVPMSIAVVTNQDIERRGLIGMEDYLRSIPGVNEIDNGAFSNAIV